MQPRPKYRLRFLKEAKSMRSGGPKPSDKAIEANKRMSVTGRDLSAFKIGDTVELEGGFWYEDGTVAEETVLGTVTAVAPFGIMVKWLNGRKKDQIEDLPPIGVENISSVLDDSSSEDEEEQERRQRRRQRRRRGRRSNQIKR